MSEEPFVVYVVDDDPDLRSALSRAITTRGLAVETFETAEAFLSAWNPERMACLILDYGLPGMSGIDLQAHVTAQGHTLPIIFVTGHGGVTEAVRAIKGGAIDFLEKPFRQSTLMERIHDATEAAFALRAERDKRVRLTTRFDRLTRRESEIVQHMIDNPSETSSKEIGRAMDISPRTVDHHRARILEKLEVSSVAEIFGMVSQLPAQGAGLRGEETEGGPEV